MFKALIYISTLLLFLLPVEAYVKHSEGLINQIWEEEDLPFFDELILSWNALRPLKGSYQFYISVKVGEWSPWLLYASWGSNHQSGYKNSSLEYPVSVYQDVFKVTDEKKASAFRVKVVPEGTSSLEGIHGLHAYVNGESIKNKKEGDTYYFTSSSLNVPGISQMVVKHSRCKDFCSPVSTLAVTRYLFQNHLHIDSFAKNVWDEGFDIYGNWSLNVAEASSHLGLLWMCWVERLNTFDEILYSLAKGCPVVVSVRGPLPGSALPYAKGHLLVVKGFDAENQRVLCMDPAFPSDEETDVYYPVSDFIEAWSRRGFLAYMFSKKE